MAMLNIMQYWSFFHCCRQKQSTCMYKTLKYFPPHINYVTMLLPYLVKLDTFEMTDIP